MPATPQPTPPARHRLPPKVEADLRDMRHIIGDGLRFLVPLGCSAWLIIWLLRKVDLRQVWHLMCHGVRWEWIIAVMLVTTASHAVRGYRWGLQLRGAGIKPTIWCEIISIFGCYSLNLLLPRLGEIWRCVFIARRERASLSTVIGTLVGDRATDGVTVIALMGLMMLVAGQAIGDFIRRYSIGRDVVHITSDPWFWAILALVVTTVWGVLHFFRHYKYIEEADGCLDRMWGGFKVLFTMRHKWLYFWLTIGIWFNYYMEVYMGFQAFSFTRALVTPEYAYGLTPGLVCFVFGSLSMAIPSNAGLGPWNLAVVFGLTLYGVGETEAVAFAMVIWSAKAVTLVILGIVTCAYVMYTSRHDPSCPWPDSKVAAQPPAKPAE